MALITDLSWLRNGEIASELVLNRPLNELVENDVELHNLKVAGPEESTTNAIPVFLNETGKSIKNSLITITDEGSLVLPEGQTIKVGDNEYISGSGGDGTRYIRWLGM